MEFDQESFPEAHESWIQLARGGILVFMTDITQILSQIEQGDPSASQQLLPFVYDELRKLGSAEGGEPERISGTTTMTCPTGLPICMPTISRVLICFSAPLTTATESRSRAPNIAQSAAGVSSLIREVVNQPDWRKGNALALVISGSGYRNAESWKGGWSGVPMLYLGYNWAVDVLRGNPPPLSQH